MTEPPKRGRPRQGRAVARDLPRDEELLRIAAEVLWERGFNGTRLDDIAAEAGISKGSLYHYFESKEEIFERLVANILGTLSGDVASVRRSLPPTERLRRVVERWVRQAAEHPLEVGLLHKELANLQGPAGEWARAVRRDNLTQLREILGDGQATGEFRPADANLLAHGIMGSISAFTEWYRPGGEIPVEHLVDEVSAWIIAGVGAPPRRVLDATADLTPDASMEESSTTPTG